MHPLRGPLGLPFRVLSPHLQALTATSLVSVSVSGPSPPSSAAFGVVTVMSQPFRQVCRYLEVVICISGTTEAGGRLSCANFPSVSPLS